jgi:RNA polymerase sigma-70 factor (ECF subfamily)
MTSPTPTEGEPDEGPGTLGDLLYADTTRPRAPEQDWMQLVHAVGGGDEAALRALYDRSHRLVFTLIMRITRSPETAQELTVDVFHDVWRRARSYDAGSGTVLGWIMNQARSRAIDRVRFENRKKRTVPDLEIEVSTTDDRAEELADAPARRLVLQQALATLTPDERLALETAYLSDLTYAEAATRLQQPLGTIKTRIRSALLKLRRKLGVEGYER